TRSPVAHPINPPHPAPPTAKCALAEHHRMGLLEVHFHDSEFTAAPSMRTGDSDTDGDETDQTPPADADCGGGCGGRGVAVAVGVLVVLGLLAGLRRRRDAA
ncbi:hypothetical protein, partial [Halobacterium salinarum]